jgi:hypothetical protein
VKLDELVVVLLTSFSISDDNVQRAYEIRKHCVDMVEPSKKGDDVGAGMRISLGQETGKKDTQSLGGRPSALDQTHGKRGIIHSTHAKGQDLGHPS